MKGKILTCVILSAMSVVTAQAAETSLDTVYVYADKNKEIISAAPGGYVNTGYEGGILGTQKIKDTPFAVTSFTQKTIQNYSDPTQPLPSVLVNTPSVRSTASTFYDDFSIRGIRLNGYQLYLNGIPGLFEQGTTPTNFVSRIDVTSGPAMGTNLATSSESAGGLVNLVSKKAEATPVSDVTLGFSGKSTFTKQLDFGRRFGDNQEWGIRVNALSSNGQTAISDERRKSNNIFVNVDHSDEHSKTNVLFGYVDDSVRNSLRWFTFDKNLKTIPSAPDIHKNYGFKALKWEADKWIATVNHEQRINKNWAAFLNAGYGKYDIYNPSNSDWRYTIQEDGTFKDNVVRNPFAYDNRTMQIGFKGKAVTGEVKHNLVFAYDKNWQKYYGSTSWKFGEVTGTLKDGILTQPDAVPAYPYAKAFLKSKTVYTSYKAIDNMEIGKFNVMLGLTKTNVTNATVGKDAVKSDALSPLYGIVYKPNDQFSFYASHTESFGKGSLISGSRYLNDGQILDPAKTKQDELGIRYENNRFMTNLSIFKISKANAMDVPSATADKYYRTNDGEQDYKGFDLSITGKLTEKWNLNAGMMYVNAKTDKSTGGKLDGLRISGTPEWSGLLGLEYNPNEDVSIFGRLTYSGSYYINNELHKLPSYAMFDLGATYHSHIGKIPVTWNAMVYNLFDKACWESLPGGDNLILSMPRSYMLSATLHF